MNLIWTIGGALLGGIAGYLVRSNLARVRTQDAETRAARILEDAERDAKSAKKEAEIQTKDERLKAREQFEVSTAAKRQELAQLEERITLREGNLDRKLALLDKKEATLDAKHDDVEKRNVELEAERARLRVQEQQVVEQLQRIAGMTRDQAKAELLDRVNRELGAETGAMIRRSQEQAKETADRQAARIISVAIQRYAGKHTNELLTSVVPLPGEDMKGRVIGKEGRNIRCLESLTGVNVLIDDTPEAVVITGFDPVRREIARQSLEMLVADGRIHPARIEEVVEQVKQNMEETIRLAGEDAVFKVGIRDVHPDLLRYLGRLKYRTSYTQNVLDHSVEVAHIIGMLAGELGLDVSVAKRVGLFHDIGKAVDHEIEGGHAVIGADILHKAGESAEVVNGVAAHHEDVEAVGPFALLASAADAISSSRPGARSETTELYIKRLQKLESIANSYEGVKKSYAIQAGREIRVFVEPAQVDDNAALVTARNISKQIEEEMKYPGQIRIVVIRETRCIEYAR
ncbi:MAG: ribonuclease Y [Verrucomicrobia bacterium]|nr:ribonuclease Y [Verrucomicrobiota bacterium]